MDWTKIEYAEFSTGEPLNVPKGERVLLFLRNVEQPDRYDFVIGQRLPPNGAWSYETGTFTPPLGDDFNFIPTHFARFSIPKGV